MADDTFVPSPPHLKGSRTDANGNMDWKNREMQVSAWFKDKGDKQFFQAKLPDGGRLCLFVQDNLEVRVREQSKTEEPEW